MVASSNGGAGSGYATADFAQAKFPARLSMKVLVNTSAQRLHLEGGIYRLAIGARVPLHEGDENKPGIVAAILKGWAHIEETAETLKDFIKEDSRAPKIVFEEETIVAGSHFGEGKPTIAALGSKQGITFEEEAFDEQGNKIAVEAVTEAAAEAAKPAKKTKA